MTLVMPIVSVNTGQLSLLGQSQGGKDVYSGIRKSPVLGGGLLFLGRNGLEGDQQTDHLSANGQRIHGGPEKAVYMYPRSHYTDWVAELGTVLVPGDFGENLTIDDALETDVCVGDRFRWGEALLEVTSPRRPCAKLNMLRGPGTSEAMMKNGRSGWYCRVVQPALVPTTGALKLLSRRADGPTIAEIFRQKIRREPIVPALREDLPDQA